MEYFQQQLKIETKCTAQDVMSITLCSCSRVLLVSLAGHSDAEKHILGTAVCVVASWDSRRPRETPARERSLYDWASTVDAWPSRVLCSVQ